MAIILEGPDAAGKTSLARMLRDQFGYNIVVSGGAPKNDAQTMEHCQMQLEACKHRYNVIDRISPISHPIYSHPYTGYVPLAEYLKTMLDNPETLLVYCRPPTEALMRPEKHEWKDYDTEEWKQQILRNQMTYIERYDEFFRTVPHLAFDYTAGDTEINMELTSMLAASQDDIDMVRRLRAMRTCP